MNHEADLPLDLIVPARDEEANITALLAAIPRGVVRRVVVVDNASADRTAELAAAGGAEVVHEPRRGYGGACLAGLAHLERSGPPGIVAFLDADLADDPAELGRLVEPIRAGRADLVIGCRHRLADPGALDPHQRFGNALACAMLRLFTGRRYRDLGPMRAVRWSSLRRLNMRDRTWGWTVEMQYKAAVMGLRIEQLDVPYRRRRAGVSKISGSLTGSARAGYKIIATILGLWVTTRRRGAARISSMPQAGPADAAGAPRGYSDSDSTGCRPAKPPSTSCQ